MKKIPSKKLAENKDAIAVLDIKPITRGHIVIIPKKQAKETKDISGGAYQLASEIASQIKEKLNAKSIEILPESKFGEVVINVIPAYDDPVSLQSPRTDPSDEELSKIYSELYEKPKLPVIKVEKPEQPEKMPQIKRKIP